MEERVSMSLDDLIKTSRKEDKTKGKKQKAAAASIGKGKANRQAQLAKNRGMQESGKATNKEVKKQTLKAGGGGGSANAAKNKNKKTGAGSMTISFSTKDLSKTTSESTVNQIMGVLAKAPKGPLRVGGGQGPKPKPKPKSRQIKIGGK